MVTVEFETVRLSCGREAIASPAQLLEPGDMVDYRELLEDLRLFGNLVFLDGALCERSEREFAAVRGIYDLGRGWLRVEWKHGFPAVVLPCEHEVLVAKP